MWYTYIITADLSLLSMFLQDICQTTKMHNFVGCNFHLWFCCSYRFLFKIIRVICALIFWYIAKLKTFNGRCFWNKCGKTSNIRTNKDCISVLLCSSASENTGYTNKPTISPNYYFARLRGTPLLKSKKMHHRHYDDILLIGWKSKQPKPFVSRCNFIF